MVAPILGRDGRFAGIHQTWIDLADPDEFRRWIQTLNDLRLAIGTRIGVTEDDGWDRESEDSDDTIEPRVLYHWLTALQDCLVTAQLP